MRLFTWLSQLSVAAADTPPLVLTPARRDAERHGWPYDTASPAPPPPSADLVDRAHRYGEELDAGQHPSEITLHRVIGHLENRLSADASFVDIREVLHLIGADPTILGAFPVSMTITEANAAQTLLAFLLPALRHGEPVDSGPAGEAAEYLAERSCAVLHAGARGTQVAEGWPALLAELGETPARLQPDVEVAQ